MNRAMQLIDRMFEAAPAPPPTKTPVRTPTAPPTPSTPRPGTRPWKPTRRPDVAPRPKARFDDEDDKKRAIKPHPKATDVGHYSSVSNSQPGGFSMAEAQGDVAVPQPPSDTTAGPEPSSMASVCDTIRPGDRVTIITAQGSRLIGRAVMRNRERGCWVLNLGGTHDNSGVADDENIVKVSRGGQPIYSKI